MALDRKVPKEAAATHTPIPIPDMMRAPTLLSDAERTRVQIAWEGLLENIPNLVKEGTQSKQRKKAFISYAWPEDAKERNALQAWLKQLKVDLERAGIQTFLDLEDMQGKLDITMKKKIEESDFILPILTPRFLERASDEKTNLAFELKHTLAKAKETPSCLLPILRQGSFGAVVKGPLQPLSKHLIYSAYPGSKQHHLLTSLSDPLGVILVMYGIRSSHEEYQSLYHTWLDSGLNRIPRPMPHAVERKKQMKAILDCFKQQQDKNRSPIQVLQGMGGVGKTQLAMLFANHNGSQKGFVRWMYADKHNFDSELDRLAKQLGLDSKGKSKEDQKSMLRDALSRQPSWLIILDNLEDLDALKGVLPEKQTADQRVLITTRSKSWGRYPVISLPPFTAEECQHYFENRLSDEQSKGAEVLAKELGYLPLALSHAVAYIQQTDITVEKYQTRYKEKGIDLLAKKDIDTEAKEQHYNHTVLTTYQLSLENLLKKNPVAAELVKFCAYLGSDGIQEQWLTKLLDLDDEGLDDVMRDIWRYGLMTREDKGLKMHRLVQGAIRASIPKAERDDYSHAVTKTLMTFYQHSVGRKISPSNLNVMGHIASAFEKRGGFSGNSVLVFSSKSSPSKQDDAKAQKHMLQSFQHILKVKEDKYGKDHWQVAGTLMKLATAHMKLGDHEKAKPLLKRALKLQEEHYGKDKFEMVDALAKLAFAYKKLSEAKEELPILERVLKLKESHYGKDHWQIADVLDTLADAHERLDDDKGKKDLLERALKIKETHHGKDHWETAVTSCNLAAAYLNLNDITKAKSLVEEAPRIFKEHYGEKHPNTITASELLVSCYRKIGSLHSAVGDAKAASAALDSYQKALAIQLKIYGEDHPQVAGSYLDLGSAHIALEDGDLALGFYQIAKTIYVKTNGEQHPNVGVCHENIGVTYQLIKDNKQAKMHFEKALVIYQKHDRQQDIRDVQARLESLPSSGVSASTALSSFFRGTSGGEQRRSSAQPESSAGSKRSSEGESCLLM